MSSDIVRLYLHIPHEEGLGISKYILEKREDQSVSCENPCRLVKIILKGNYFELGSGIYHQLLGTAISTKFAPNVGNIFMAGLEKDLFKKLKFKPYFCLRYLEDVFCIWQRE